MFGWGKQPEVPIYPELESPQTPEGKLMHYLSVET